MAKRYIGLDVGDRRIGVAVSDELFITAQALETYHREGDARDVEHFRALAGRFATASFVLGLPRNMNGTYGPQAEKVKRFGNMLAEELGIEVIYYDERLTTAMAQRSLIEANMSRAKRKNVVDRVAAVHILQGFIDQRRLYPEIKTAEPEEQTKRRERYIMKEHVHDENCTHDTDEELDIIELVDEDGETEEFSFVGSFEMGENTYIALETADMPEDSDETELVILRVETDDDGQDTYVGIEDEDEIEAAFKRFLELLEEEDDEE